MNKQPLLLMLLCYVLGIFFCDVRPTSIHQTVFLMSFALVFTMLSFFKVKILKELKNYSLGFLFFSVGVFSHYWHSKKSEIPNFQGKQTVVFQINKKLNSNKKYRKYEVLAKAEGNEINAILYVPKEEKQLDFKNYYQTKVYINKVESPKNDFQFDYAKYLARKGIYYQSFATDEILEAPKKTLAISEKIRQKRLEILNTIDGSKLPKREREFLKGIILADRTEMDAETVKDFNQTGLVHLLAISGSHMVIIFWLTLLIFNQILPVKFRKVSIVLSILLIWTFAIFIDYGSSVMRSCLMITCYYLMVLLQRKSDLLHSLALSAFILLTFDSNQLFDVGFQLSYVAVLGIWWLTNPIKNLFRKPRFKAEKVFYEISAMTFAAQIATLPLAIYYFHQFSFVSIIANLLIIPLSELIIVSSLVIVILIAFGFSNIPVIYKGFDVFVEYILKLIHWFSNFESLMTRNISLNIFELSILLLVIYFLKFLIKDFFNPKNLLRFGFCLLAFFVVRISFNLYQYNKEEMLVHGFYKEKIVSIKDKDHAIFWMKENKNEDKISDFVINPYLTSRRIKDFKINYIPVDSEAFVYEGKQYDLK